MTGWLRTAINDLLTSWELEPANEAGKAARGDDLVDQLCYLGAPVRYRVRDTLHTRVKQAMVVVCFGFSYDMEIVSHGFATDISKTDAENEERLHALIDEAEGPDEMLVKLFEPEVLPPKAGADAEDEGRDGGNDDQGL